MLQINKLIKAGCGWDPCPVTTPSHHQSESEGQAFERSVFDQKTAISAKLF